MWQGPSMRQHIWGLHLPTSLILVTFWANLSMSESHFKVEV